MGTLGELDPIASTAPRAFARANLLTTVLGFLLSLGIGLWYTPFLVRHLGPAAYGLVPLATTVVSYFSLLTQTLSSALNRSISIALASGDAGRAGRAFGSALGGAVLIVALLVPVLGLLSWLAPHLFSIPAKTNGEVRALFAFVSATLLFSILSTPYQSLTFGQNRIYVSNLVAVVQTLVRVGLTAGLFAFGANLLDAGWGIVSGGGAALLLTILAARAYSPRVRIMALQFDARELRGIARTSSHVLLMQVGTVLVMSLEVVIANRLFGAYQGGRYAAVTQWLLLLRNATMQLVVLAVPTILRLVANNDRTELIAFTCRAMTWCAVVTALPVGFLCALSPLILHAWLGAGFADLWPIAVVQLVPLIIVSTVLPLYSIMLGTDRMLVGGLTQIAVGIAGVAAAIGLGGAWGPVGVAIGVNWCFALKEIVFTPLYAASSIGAPRRTFYPPVVAGLLLAGLAAALSWAAGHLFGATKLPTLFITGIAVGLVYSGICAVLFPTLREQALALVKPRAMLARLGWSRLVAGN